MEDPDPQRSGGYCLDEPRGCVDGTNPLCEQSRSLSEYLLRLRSWALSFGVWARRTEFRGPSPYVPQQRTQSRRTGTPLEDLHGLGVHTVKMQLRRLIPFSLLVGVAVLSLVAAVVGATTDRGSRPARNPAASSAGSSTTSTSTPIAVSSNCYGVAVAAPSPPPSSSALKRSLLTKSDVPSGYETSGPQVKAPLPEFYDALPESAPVAHILFLLSASPGTGGTPPLTQDSISEELSKAASPRIASGLLRQVKAAAQACGAVENPVAIPASVPNVSASEVSGAVSNMATASAEVILQEGDYLVRIRLTNSNYANPSSDTFPAQPSLPTPGEIASIVDAALAHLLTSG